MCRNIKTLFNFDPPATEDEVRASALQFVRKLSGFTKPSRANEASFNTAVDDASRANEASFNTAVDDASRVARTLIDSLVTQAPARNREVEAAKAKARAAKRYGMLQS